VADTVPSGLDAWHFADDPLMVVMPRGHALATKEKLRFAQVVEHPMVGVQPGGSLDRTLRDRALASNLEIRLAVTVNSFDAVCRMVQAGLGIAVVPQSAASAYAGSVNFERRPLDEPWRGRKISMLALRKNPRPAPVAALVSILRASDPGLDAERDVTEATPAAPLK
jgi:DNA-binding transcriptional LysR family regulator